MEHQDELALERREVPTPRFSRVICIYEDDQDTQSDQQPGGKACWESYQAVDAWARTKKAGLPAVDPRPFTTRAGFEARLVELSREDLGSTLLSIETHGTKVISDGPWKFSLPDRDFHGPSDWSGLADDPTPRLRPALAVIGGCGAGSLPGRECVETCLADGVVYVASPDLTWSEHLRGRVLPAVLDASRNTLPVGDSVSPAGQTLNGLLARAYGKVGDRPSWVAWRAYVSGQTR